MRPPPVRRTPVERKSAAIHDGWASRLTRKTDELDRAAAVNGHEPVDQTNAPARAFAGPNLDLAASSARSPSPLLTPRDAQLCRRRGHHAVAATDDRSATKPAVPAPMIAVRSAAPIGQTRPRRSAPTTWPESAPDDHLGAELRDSLAPVARVSDRIAERTLAGVPGVAIDVAPTARAVSDRERLPHAGDGRTHTLSLCRPPTVWAMRVLMEPRSSCCSSARASGRWRGR